MTRPIPSFALLIAVVLAAGCTSTRFPYGGSFDKHNITSQGHTLWRVEIQDTVTHETLWAMDVPENKMLVIDFETDKSYLPTQTGALPAEKMTWGLFDPDETSGDLENEVELSGNPVLMRKTLRSREVAAAAPPAAYMPDDAADYTDHVDEPTDDAADDAAPAELGADDAPE